MFEFKKAEREQLKLRLAIAGASGAGKTYSALRIASGLLGDGGKIAVIDTENNSATLYSDEFEFQTGNLQPPYNPERFVEALRSAEKAGFDCVIIDTISHAWTGEGGILDIHNKSAGANSFVAWKNITPRHNRLFEAILQSPIHVIVTMRSKQSYALQSNDKGKQVPVKMGLAPVQRDDVEYEFTVALAMDINNQAHSTKDRTRLFPPDLYFLPTEDTGQILKDWLAKGVPAKAASVKDCMESIRNCATLEELQSVFGAINANRRHYSKADMTTLIEEKDTAKKILSAAAAQPSAPPAAPPTPEPAPKKESVKPTEEEPPPKADEEKHPDVLRLKNMLLSPEWKAAVEESITRGEYGEKDWENIITSNARSLALDAIDFLEDMKKELEAENG